MTSLQLGDDVTGNARRPSKRCPVTRATRGQCLRQPTVAESSAVRTESRPARRPGIRRFYLITDVSTPSRQRATSNGFMRFRGSSASTRSVSDGGSALNGPIHHRPTLIRLRPPLLQLSRLSKFAFLTASLGSTHVVRQIDHRAGDMRARGHRKNLPVGRRVGRAGPAWPPTSVVPAAFRASIGRTLAMLTGIQMTA